MNPRLVRYLLCKRLIKAPKLYFADTGLLCHLLGFRDPRDMAGHALWGAVWENFVVSEVRKRLLDTGRPPACWFWRTAQGDEVDLIVEIDREGSEGSTQGTQRTPGAEPVRPPAYAALCSP